MDTNQNRHVAYNLFKTNHPPHALSCFCKLSTALAKPECFLYELQFKPVFPFLLVIHFILSLITNLQTRITRHVGTHTTRGCQAGSLSIELFHTTGTNIKI